MPVYIFSISKQNLLNFYSNFQVTGTSFHVGSGCSDMEAYERAIRKAKNLFKFGQLLGYDLDLLDIGGGFPGSDDEHFIKVRRIWKTCTIIDYK